MDVTLACADGSTLDAHKVILSSVSTYFRDILKVHAGVDAVVDAVVAVVDAVVDAVILLFVCCCR